MSSRHDHARFVLLLSGALALASACGSESRGNLGAAPPPVSVETVTATPRSLPRILAAVGSLVSPQTTVVAAEIAGTVVEFDIPEGQQVEAGHVLARLDDDEARAAVVVARARFESAQQRRGRATSLRAADVASEQAHDDAVTQFNAATGELEEAETRLRKTVLRAPFAGVLGLRRVNRGQYLDRGEPVVEITQTDPLELEFSIPQNRASEVATGQTVLGTVGLCGRRFEGVVDVVDPQVDPATRALRIKAVVPNPEGALFPGMAARVRLVVGEHRDAIVIPQESIIRLGTMEYVYVLDEADQARQREVVLGEFFVDGVHVTQGLSPGERVVVSGHQKLRPGALAKALDYTPVRNPLLELGWHGPMADCEA